MLGGKNVRRKDFMGFFTNGFIHHDGTFNLFDSFTYFHIGKGLQYQEQKQGKKAWFYVKNKELY